MSTVLDLQEKRAKLVKGMREILDAAEADNDRDLTADETQKYEAMEAELDEIEDGISAKQKAAERRARLEAAGADGKPPRKPKLDWPPDAGDDGESARDLYGVMQRAFADGASRREAIREVAKSAGNPDRMAAFREYLVTPTAELRDKAALRMDSDTGGGVLIPDQFLARLIDGLDERVFLRQLGTVLPMTNAASISAPSLDNDPADSDWTTELAIGGTDTTMDFGKRMLHPHPVAKLLKVSKTLLRRSPMSVDGIVRDRLTFKMAVTQEKGFMTGSGSQQPLGLFTAHADGISTGQDVSTDNTTTAITADGLIEAKYALSSQYLSGASLRWLFHRDAVKQIRKLKDGNGQYLWQPGLAGDRQGTILDEPYEVSEYAPNTFTTGQYVGMIADFSWYWIVDSLAVTIEVLNELYAATNESGYVLRAETDGMPVLEEAFVRVTLA